MQAWEQFLQHLGNELGTETVEKWLKNLKIQRYDACNLYLEAQDSFQALWFEEHIRSKALKLLVNGNNKQIKIHLSVANTPPIVKSKKREPKNKKLATNTPNFQITFDALDPLSLFSTYVISEENQIVYKILQEIANTADASTYNPLYLYGSNGSGKTHLLMSLSHALKSRGLKVLYVRAETFTDHVVTAIRAGEMSHFRQIYRNIDALIIDDIHIFSRKNATQEEFFHTFNTLHLMGKQIIISANCSPQDLQNIEARLISRFEWGIVLSIQPLEKDQMQKMLERKAKALNFRLSNSLIEFFIETFTSNPKAMVKALEALVLRLHLEGRHATTSSLTVPAAKTILSDLVIEEQKSAITPLKIIQEVAEYFGLHTEDILGKSQTRKCVLPRQIAMHLCRTKLKMPFMKIGELFARDHSTIISGVNQIQKILELNDPETAGAWHIIHKKLQT